MKSKNETNQERQLQDRKSNDVVESRCRLRLPFRLVSFSLVSWSCPIINLSSLEFRLGFINFEEESFVQHQAVAK